MYLVVSFCYCSLSIYILRDTFVLQTFRVKRSKVKVTALNLSNSTAHRQIALEFDTVMHYG